MKKWLADVKKAGAKIAVIDAPLLFESGADALCDITVGVIAPYTTRMKRVIKRDGIDKKSENCVLIHNPRMNFSRKNAPT